MDVLLWEDRGVERPPLAEALAAAGVNVRERVANAAALEGALDRHRVDAVVLDLVTPRRSLLEEMGALGLERGIPIAVFVERTDPEATRVAVRAGISSYVVRGAQVDRLCDALDVACARFVELTTLLGEVASLRTSLAERKVIERAKGCLMRREGLDEQGAYDTLRRIAMRRSCRIAEVASAVLSEEPV